MFFFFNDTATTEIYTLSLHDALPISATQARSATTTVCPISRPASFLATSRRSEEHTSELQSRLHLVCRLLLEKKKDELEQEILRQHIPRHRHSTRAAALRRIGDLRRA